MGLLVLSGEQKLTTQRIKTYHDLVREKLRPAAKKQGVDLPAPGTISGSALYAVVDANKWIVHCPTCKGAEFAWKTAPYFMCSSCWNGANQIPHTFREVVFPDDLQAIEQVLMVRPSPINRNWLGPDFETVQDLQAENEANGLPPGGM